MPSARCHQSTLETRITPAILCGGTGTRLSPLSRATDPKQYWALAGDGDDTLLQQTHQRLEGIAGLQEPLLICNEDHRFIVAEQMRQIGVEPATAAGARRRSRDRGRPRLRRRRGSGHAPRPIKGLSPEVLIPVTAWVVVGSPAPNLPK